MTTTKKSRFPECKQTRSHPHPDHSPILTRLRKVQGQLNGIEKMVEQKRYCVDILIQFRASMGALRNLEADVFNRHLKHCVKQAFHSKNEREAEKKIEEITDLLIRRTQI